MLLFFSCNIFLALLNATFLTLSKLLTFGIEKQAFHYTHLLAVFSWKKKAAPKKFKSSISPATPELGFAKLL